MNNQRFLNKYNCLEHYLKQLVGDRHINIMSIYGKIRPNTKSAEMDTVRKFKNTIESHGVLPGYATPIVPELWIRWLENEINYCKNNSRVVRALLLEEINKKSYNTRNKTTNIRHNRVVEDVKLSKFGEQIMIELRKINRFPAKNYENLVSAGLSVVNKYSLKELKNCRSYYRIKSILLADVRYELAKELTARLGDKEINYLLGR